jgi:hypothetical protein
MADGLIFERPCETQGRHDAARKGTPVSSTEETLGGEEGGGRRAGRKRAEEGASQTKNDTGRASETGRRDEATLGGEADRGAGTKAGPERGRQVTRKAAVIGLALSEANRTLALATRNIKSMGT